MRFAKTTVIIATLGFGLAACGQTDLERTATGAVIGGAVASATGGDVGQGALIGGAAGATCRSLGTCPNN